MTDRTEADESTTNVPLPSTNGNWALNEVVYTHYTYDDTLPTGQKVSATTRSYALPRSDIKKFVEQRMKRLPLPQGGRFLKRCPKDPKPDRPLNIYVTDPCWVVIELDQDIDWHFEPNHPGITTKSDYGDDNCDLVHVMPVGPWAGPAGPPTVGCKLIYFVVQRRLRGDMEHQEFRCHIVHGRKRLDDPVEPDIPNDGGKFPFPVVGVPDPGKSCP